MLTCLNRKKGFFFEPEAICNIRGHRLEPDETCTHYMNDTSVITDKAQQKWQSDQMLNELKCNDNAYDCYGFRCYFWVFFLFTIGFIK